MNIEIHLANPADTLDMAEVYMRSWEVSYKNIVPADFINKKEGESLHK